MVKKVKKYPHAFFERNTWNHRTKKLLPDYTIKYGKKGGFETAEEAEKAYQEHIKEFDRKMNMTFLEVDKEVTLKNFLLYWYVSIFSERVQSTTRYLVSYLIKVAKDTRIYLYILFALLMGLRKSEISGIKYTDIDYENRTLKIERQLGRSLEVDENEIAPKTRTKQEIDVKTPASNRVEKIPNFLFSEILEERKKYEKNRSRRQHGRWVFQDMD